jgi:hypothetical protein
VGYGTAIHLHHAFTKYGEAAFVWALVEEVPKDRDALTVAEQWWMDVVGRGRLFNTAPAAGSNLGFRCTPEQREACATKNRHIAQMPHVKAAKSASMKARHAADPSLAAACRELMAARWLHQEQAVRANLDSGRATRWADPEARAAQSARSTDYANRPEVRAASSARAKAQMDARTPEQVAATMAKRRATIARRREEKG